MDYRLQSVRINRQGFTLIEVLIAIVLLSILMLFVANIVSDSTKTKDDVLMEDGEVQQIETAMSRIATDLEQIYSPAYFSAMMDPRKLEDAGNDQSLVSGFERSERYPEVTAKGHPIPLLDNPEKQTLIFMASVNRRKAEEVKQSDYAWIQYTLEDNTDENKNAEAPFNLVRYYNANNPYFTENNWDEIKPQLLLKNVKKLEFNFWHSARKKFVESLKELNEEKNTPRLIQVKLSWVDSFNQTHEEVRTFRPLWQPFDAIAEQKELDAINKANRVANPDSPAIPGNDGDDDDE